MSVQKAISGNNVKNNGSSLLHAGNVTRNEIGNIDFGLTNMEYVGQPNVSGLTQKGIAGGDFNVDNRLVAMALTTSIGGNATNILSAGAGIQIVSAINAFPGYNRIDLENINMLNGEVTYGANRGDFVLPSGLDGSTKRDADLNTSPSYAVPSKLVYRQDPGPETKNFTEWTG